MSHANTILTAMRPSCIYRVCDLAAMTNIDVDTVRYVLQQFERGGSRGAAGQRIPAQAAVSDEAARAVWEALK